MSKTWMQRALELASEHIGKTSPNPLVGAVIVKKNKLIAEGAHEKAGEAHAEINALNNATESVKNATMFVTLEPCAHWGKTPPCTEAIIKSSIKKVVIAMQDPNPLVSGKGISILKESGIEVVCGICEQEAKTLNEVFSKFITTKKPFVILKAAISLDGKIATKSNHSRWINNDKSREIVHQLRNQTDAILVGKNTFLLDNPKLDSRLATKIKDPQKIIIIPKLDVEPEQIKKSHAYQLSKAKKLLILTENSVENVEKAKSFENLNLEILFIKKIAGKLDLNHALEQLGNREITSLLLEGGSHVFHSFIAADLVDKYHLFIAPKIIGNDGISWTHSFGTEKMEDCISLENLKIENIDDDIHVIAYPKRKLCLQES
jgi:diaminohydroxyphosphoribosylaminopyrimidine deaminase/5-amino-6-(5-phosphoribosylamino)uracil reductase